MRTDGLRVAVQVDEPRRDHTTHGIQHDAPAQARADGGNARMLDRKVHGHVETLPGVDHTSAADHDGKLDHALRRWRPCCRGAAGQTGNQEQESAPVNHSIT
jgi:hypothetical protein